MADKSGGDVLQANQGSQGNISAQDLNALGVAGAGIVDGFGGSAVGTGLAQQTTNQNQAQGNIAATGSGGDDNISADTTINIA